MTIVTSLAKNEDFVKIKYEDLKEQLFNYLRVLLNKCYYNQYLSIDDALYHVQYLAGYGKQPVHPATDAILLILNQLKSELNDAKHCFDCVYNQVMFENGFARVCSKPHLLMWCKNYGTNRDDGMNGKNGRFSYWCPTKVIVIQHHHFLCRSFADGCSTLRTRIRKPMRHTIELLSLKTQSSLGSAYSLTVDAIHMLNLHLIELRNEFGNSKMLYHQEPIEWNRKNVHLMSNRDMSLKFPNFQPNVLCHK